MKKILNLALRKKTPPCYSHHAHNHNELHSEVSHNTDKKLLTISLFTLGMFMLTELIIGIVINSLVLMTDAAHMLTDVLAIILALIGLKFTQRPVTINYTYGYDRVSILSAQINGITLLLLSGFFVKEAISSIFNNSYNPPGLLISVVGLLGFFINIIVTFLIGKANKESINIQGVYAHVLTDLYAFAATIIAGIVIKIFHWYYADAVAALIVAILMLVAGWRLVKAATFIFLEKAPANVSSQDVINMILGVEKVIEVHDFHLWQITSTELSLSAHIIIELDTAQITVRSEIENKLRINFGVTHTTIQFDYLESNSPINSQKNICKNTHGSSYSIPFV